MKNNEKGRSMIEMLGVLSIAGILSMSGIALYSKALYQRKISNTIDQVSEFMTNMRNYYRNRRSFELPSATYDPRGLIPESMIMGNELKSALGTAIKISKGGENTKEFYIELIDEDKKIDQNACAKIVTSDWGKNVWVAIGGKSNITSNTKEGPISVTDAANQNTGCKRNANNSISFLVK